MTLNQIIAYAEACGIDFNAEVLTVGPNLKGETLTSTMKVEQVGVCNVPEKDETLEHGQLCIISDYYSYNAKLFKDVKLYNVVNSF